MTTDQIINLVIGICPSIIAILTALSVVIRVIKDFKDLKNQVTDMKSIDEIKLQITQLLHENYELKKTLNETLTKLDRVERKP